MLERPPPLELLLLSCDDAEGSELALEMEVRVTITVFPFSTLEMVETPFLLVVVGAEVVDPAWVLEVEVVSSLLVDSATLLVEVLLVVSEASVEADSSVKEDSSVKVGDELDEEEEVVVGVVEVSEKKLEVKKSVLEVVGGDEDEGVDVLDELVKGDVFDDDGELILSLKPPMVADREVEEGEAGVTLKKEVVPSKRGRAEELSLSARLYNTDE